MIKVNQSTKAQSNPDVQEAIEVVTRDLNAIASFNPARTFWIDVVWGGRGWRIYGKSKLPIEGPSIVTERIKYVMTR